MPLSPTAPDLPPMHIPIAEPHVVLNGRLVSAAEARISPLSDGFMYGLGLFETIKVLNDQPVFFAAHFERLRRGAADLDLALTTSGDELHARCGRCIAANQPAAGGLKIVVFQDAGQVGELILPRAGAPSAEHYARGFRLKTAPDSRDGNDLIGLKTLNYLTCLRARRAAQAAGFDETLFVAPSGAITEGTMSNVFVVSAGIVHTPPLVEGILPGIARAAVLRTGKNAIREISVSTSQLFDADEVFITNSILGVMPVAEVDGRRFDVAHNPVTRSIMEAYRALELASVVPR